MCPEGWEARLRYSQSLYLSHAFFAVVLLPRHPTDKFECILARSRVAEVNMRSRNIPLNGSFNIMGRALVISRHVLDHSCRVALLPVASHDTG
jgi:hypothetical protein